MDTQAMAREVLAEDAYHANRRKHQAWHIAAGITKRTVRLDFNLEQDPALLVIQIEALADRLARLAKDARRLVDPVSQTSLIQAALIGERAKLARRTKG